MLPAAGHGMHVQTQEIAQQSIPAMAQTNGLQPSKQAALLFIEQPIEQQNGSLQFIGGNLKRGGMDRHRDGMSTAPGQHLGAARDGFDGGIKKLAIHFHAPQALLRDQVAKRLLHFCV